MATLRKTCNPPNFRAKISDVIRPKIDYEDGTKEFAVSTVDELLPRADAFISSKVDGTINKHGLWESIMNELESTCVAKKEQHAKGVTRTVYSVPVVGYKQFLHQSVDEDYLPGAYNGYCTENPIDTFTSLQKSLLKKIKRNPAMYMFWRGCYYDVGLVYLHQPERSEQLKAVGSLKAAIPRLEHDATEFTTGVSYRTFRRAPVPHTVRIGHSNAVYTQDGAGWRQADPLDYLEINLLYPRYVTHIGTTGGLPNLVGFPSYNREYSRHRRPYNPTEVYELAPLLSARGNGISRNKFSSYVRILKEGESELAWVTSYEVYYSHHVTNKWTLLLVTAGNTDALTEVVLDLSPHFNSREGLFTQALRIRPLTHHRRPTMRVSVYGRDPQQPSPVTHPSHGDRGVDGESPILGDDVDGGEGPAVAMQDTPTIDYMVTTTLSKDECRYVRDGRQMSSRYYYDYGKGDVKFQKKKGWHATIREEANSYFYEDELEY